MERQLKWLLSDALSLLLHSLVRIGAYQASSLYTNSAAQRNNQKYSICNRYG